MKLSEIQIDRFGVWRDMRLPLRTQGMNVLYGPNEAGKSTLMQFIRGVLFGFSSRLADGDAQAGPRTPMAGSLVVDHGDRQHRIHRAVLGTARGQACLIGEEAARPADELLEALVGGLNASVFDSVFAVGLREIQELGTLSGEETAKHIYGLSLGPDGQRLLGVWNKARDQKHRLIDPFQKQGRLVELFEKQDQLTARMAGLDAVRQQHAEWCRRRDQLEGEIADLRKRQAGIREQLRGHRFLERSWGPWNRTQECERELDQLPDVDEFPERGLERLDKLDDDLADAAESRDKLRGEAKQIRQQLRDAAKVGGWGKQGPVIRSLVQQSGQISELLARSDAAKSASENAELEYEAVRETLGTDWPTARIETLSLDAAGQQRFGGTAQSFRKAAARRRGLKRKLAQLAGQIRDLKEGLQERLIELNVESVEAAMARAKQRLEQLHELSQLRLEEAELQQRLAGLEEHRARIVPQMTLPKWVYIVLGVFCFVGIFLAGWGVITGMTHSGIAGAIYALLGITCGGLAWGLKTQYEGDSRTRLAELESQFAENLEELQAVREEIGKFGVPGPKAAETTDTSDAGGPLKDETGAAREIALIKWTTQEIAELEELARLEQQVGELRQERTGIKQKLETARREVATARQSWRELLAKLSLPESIPVSRAMETWNTLQDAAEKLRGWKQAKTADEMLAGIAGGYRQQIADLVRRMKRDDLDAEQPTAVLQAWEQELPVWKQVRKERRGSKNQIRQLWREAAEYHALAEDLKVQRNALLMQGGAATREEFEERAHAADRRTFLEDQLEDARRDLDAISADHNDLALVEEDLRAYKAEENGRCIEMLRLEEHDLEQDLQQAFERLGGVKHEIHLLEEDREGTSVRFELERVKEDLLAAAAEWCAVETATQSLDEMRHEYERTHQPSALAAASKFLARLTRGRYVNVWSPLDERKLLVDDDRGTSVPVEALSRGTREQLFLAVRLAVVQDLAEKGISLPMMLDDVIVNFDQQRAESAVELLLDFANQNRQVLFFTCHLHLAQMFQGRGVEPIWLPAHGSQNAETEHRMAG